VSAVPSARQVRALDVVLTRGRSHGVEERSDHQEREASTGVVRGVGQVGEVADHVICVLATKAFWIKQGQATVKPQDEVGRKIWLPIHDLG
jgi:nitrite reductase/ring-hydroxylating ferredoxin subunit